jgi:RNA polymerase sigma-70 factor (ECF subfamily)
MLIQAQAGNRTALDILLKEMIPWLFHLVRLAVGNEPDAWDVVQETVLRFYQNIPKFNPGRGDVRNWVARIAGNQVIDFRRRQARRRVVSLPENEVSSNRNNPAWLAERNEDYTLVRNALDNLETNERAAVTLRYDSGLSYEELSKALRIPIGTAGSRVHRGIKSMRARIQHAG